MYKMNKKSKSLHSGCFSVLPNQSNFIDSRGYVALAFRSSRQEINDSQRPESCQYHDRLSRDSKNIRFRNFKLGNFER